MKKKRLNSCNVLGPTLAGNRLWRFGIDDGKSRLEGEDLIVPPAPVPVQHVEKNWSDLWKPRFNIAWLPANQIFLRVVQLPAADRQEILSMLEFQLERISPLPVAQVLWTAEIIPSAVENMKTAVVCLVERDAVEGFLGELDAANFQPDRLEVPHLNQILAGGLREDGAWIYPGTGMDQNLCMVAWWSSGTLQQLQLLRLPELPPGSGSAEDILEIQGAALHEQLMQIAWAGELEGWVSLPVRWRLVADADTARAWKGIIARWADEEVEPVPPKTGKDLALFSAERAAKMEPTADLLPPEFAAKYHQRFIDKLWMGGLGAVIATYMAGVVVYIIALQIFDFRQSRVQSEVAGLANTYTNVLRLKEQVQVLQEQFDLKYAALDSFKVTAELLPADFTLTSLTFGRGGMLELHGVAPQGQEAKITEFNEAMRNASIDGERVFGEVGGPNIVSRPGSPNVSWNFQSFFRVTEQ